MKLPDYSITQLPNSSSRLVPLLVACLCVVVAHAQSHTLVVLSHTNHTVYEFDPSTGRAVHEYVAPDQPHEAAVSADGATVYASVPAASIVEILDGRTLARKGRIESEYFKRTPQPRQGRGGAAAGPPNTSASPH